MLLDRHERHSVDVGDGGSRGAGFPQDLGDILDLASQSSGQEHLDCRLLDAGFAPETVHGDCGREAHLLGPGHANGDLSG